VGGLSNLHPYGEVCANQRVENTGRSLLDRRCRRILSVRSSATILGTAAAAVKDTGHKDLEENHVESWWK
jgi:hypothetical protein